MKKFFSLLLIASLALVPSAAILQPAPTPVSPLTGNEQFVLQYPCTTNCFTTSQIIKNYVGGGSGGNTISLTAGTNIAAGTSVSINSSGQAVQTWGPAPNIAGVQTVFANGGLPGFYPYAVPLVGGAAAIYVAPNTAGFVAAPGAVNVGLSSATISGTTLTAGTPDTSSVPALNAKQVIPITATQAVLLYNDPGNSNITTAVVATLSAGALSYGTPLALDVTNSGSVTFSGVLLNTGLVIVAYQDDTTSNVAFVALSISGTTITKGTAQVSTVPSVPTYFGLTKLSTSVFFAYGTDNGNNAAVVGVTASVSGTTIGTLTVTDLSASSVVDPTSTGNITAAVLDSSHVVVGYFQAQAGAVQIQGISMASALLVPVHVAGTMTFGDPQMAEFTAPYDGNNTNSFGFPALPMAALDATHAVVAPGYSNPIIATLSGDTTLAVGPTSPLSAQQGAMTATLGPTLGYALEQQQNLSTNSVAALSSSLFMVADNISDIYEGSVSAGAITALSPHFQHRSTWAYTLNALTSTTALATFVTWDGNIQSRIVTAEPIANGPIGFAASACTSGNACTITVSGVASGLSGLTPGLSYFSSGDGTITTVNVAGIGTLAGVALTSSTLLIQRGRTNYLLKRDLNPASNDNTPMYLDEAA
jgi:hypothetical protein